jgi:2-keto-4-pentenoate hydratase/2-oxohepta-3-ene-1,7-dioic acid hydratase in catechol pathway
VRVARYRTASGPPAFGVLDDGGIRPASGSWSEGFVAEGEVVALDQVQLLAPVTPRTVMCVGRNYAEHARELGNEPTAEPLLFLKPPTSVIGPGGPIELPAVSERVDHEAEIVIVIGASAHRVRAEDALDHVFGCTLGNDVTARDLQRTDGQWTRAKGFNTFCAIGPWVDTDVDVADVDVACFVNDDLRQQGRTRDLVFGVPFLIEYITRIVRLEAGDVIFTGTPAGVGPLGVGDTVRVHSDAIGDLLNPVAAEP